MDQNSVTASWGLAVVARLASWAVAVALLAVLTGCGRYYWTQPGEGMSGFEVASQACIDDIRAIKYPVEPARIYRVCMSKRGWQRTQLAAPVYGFYRGAESEEEARGLRTIIQPDPYQAQRDACQRRITLILRPRSAYADAFNQCMAER